MTTRAKTCAAGQRTHSMEAIKDISQVSLIQPCSCPTGEDSLHEACPQQVPGRVHCSSSAQATGAQSSGVQASAQIRLREPVYFGCLTERYWNDYT